MMPVASSLIGILSVAGLLLAVPVSAQGPAMLRQDLDAVSGGALLDGFQGGQGVTFFNISGACDIRGATGSSCLLLGLVEYIANSIIFLIAAVATLILLRAGIALISGQEENKMQLAKQQIMSSVIALVLMFLSDKFVTAFFAPGGVMAPDTAANIARIEVNGLISWVLEIVPVVAMLMIVISGLKAASSFGKEDGITDMRKSIVGIATGFVLLLGSGIVVATLGVENPGFALPFSDAGTPNVTPLVSYAFLIAFRLLTYLAFAASCIIIYGAIVLIMKWGSEDQLGNTRKLIGRVLTGLIVVFFSYIVLQFVWTLLA